MADIHVLDEAERHAGVPGPAGHRDDGRLVDAAPDDHVDLDRRQPRLERGIDAVEHLGDREVDPVHRAEHRVVERVQADRHATQAGVCQRLRERPQGRAVRRQRQVEGPPGRCPQVGQHPDELGQPAPDQRLTAGDPQLLDAELDEGPGGTVDLLEGQHLVLGQERVVAPEDLLWHAVGAAEVAPVGDGDAQVVQRPPETVERMAWRGDDRWGLHFDVHRSAEPPLHQHNATRYGASTGTTGVHRWYH